MNLTLHKETETTPYTQTIPGIFWNQVKTRQDQIALRHKDFGIWQEVTWAEYGEQVRACAFGLMSLGLQPGDRVTILSEDRPEWFYADLGIQSAGGIAVGLYATGSADQSGYVVGHAEAQIWVVEDQEQFDKAASARAQLPELAWIVVIDPKGLRDVDDPTVITFDDLLERGRDLERVEPNQLEDRLSAIDPDDTAILFYTSGTTGRPKGVMHSHATCLRNLESLDDFLQVTERDELLVYGPLCHVSERWLGLINTVRSGATANFAELPETIFSDLVEVAPTLFFAMPRSWEKLKARISIGIEEATWLKRSAYRFALRIGYRRIPYLLKQRSTPLWLGLAWTLTYVVIVRKLLERLGLHRVRVAAVGAASVAPEVIEFMLAHGIPIREAYGATEMGIPITTPENDNRPGLKGTLVDGFEVRINPEGELLFRGPGLMQGYYKDTEKTEETLKHGWYHTGDVGSFDDDGYLTLTGRTKDMIVTSAGRNIYPQAIEDMLKASDYILDAIVIGEAKPYLTTLIVLDEETVSHHAQTHGIPFSSYADMTSKPEIVRLIDGHIQSVNRRWSDREQIVDFRILKWELSDEDDELTATMKVRRSYMVKQYSDLIDEMYK